MKHNRTRRGLLAGVLSALVILAGLSFVTPAEPASAATASDFDPGDIISDANFFNGNAMSAAAVQSFLNAQVPTCRSGYTCVKDYHQDTWTRPADAMCNTYSGAAGESAATIIYKVGQACNISQAVLIVLLQKEQSLITDTWPSQSQYTSATGFACPDTAACDTDYSGFYNQVYKAAWQYKRYSNPPGTSNFFNWFPVGQYSNVLYNPNAACGSAPVLIQNQATAGLYYYTPYQPNATAMSNVYGGQTDGCSSYGNRNFWRLYTDWFGDPRGNANPNGSFDNAYGVVGGVEVTGWAVDPKTDAGVTIVVGIDGVAASSFTANYPLNWIPALRSGLSATHGFSNYVGASPGNHTVCVSKEDGTDLGCKSVSVPSGARAAGYLDTADAVVGGVHITGWSVNKVSGAPQYIWVNVDNGGTAYPVDKHLPWTTSLFPGVGDVHGFDQIVPTSPGTHNICVFGVDSILISCKTVFVPSNEAGAFENATGVLGGVNVSGWSVDKRTSGASYVWVFVDGAGGPLSASASSDTAGAAYPALGKNHGFSGFFGASPGPHQVCVTGTLENTSYGCKTVTVPNNEVGSFDTVTAVMGKITVTGWALDQRTSAPTYVWVFVDGVGGPVKADVSLPWIPILYPQSGPNHGFNGSISATGGHHTVCVVGTTENVSFGCKDITVPTSGAASLDSVTTSDRMITLSGWSVDRLSTATTYLWVTLDGVAQVFRADQPLSWINNYFPGVGQNHGFSIQLPTGVGSHTVCVTATFDNEDLGCQTVDVPSTGAASVDSVSGVPGGVHITGWAVNRATTETTYLWVDVDGAGSPVPANVPLGWIDNYFPGVGSNHGIDSIVPASSGTHKVCIRATFDLRDLGCSTVTVP